MYWCVLIGAVLIAGTLAGSDLAVAAEPNSISQLADTTQTVAPVDVELIIAVDVSYSMDLDELAVQ